MKISFGLIVHNGEPFIKYQLESLYPHAHQIIIVEGAVEKFRHAATQDGHSLDRTVEIIKSFPDPEGKIKLIQRNSFWPEKTEMSNAYMEACTGDYIWQIDVDEFYKKEDMERVAEILLANPDIVRVDLKTINFWKGFRAVMRGASYVYGADEFIRIYRFRPGYSYSTHRPPTVVDENGKEVRGRILSASELSEKSGVYIYHYSYVFPDSVKNKSAYYAKMGWGQGCDDGVKWAGAYWDQLKNPLRIHLINFPPSWVEPFSGEHPALIKRLIADLNFQEDEKLLVFLNSDWKRFAKAGAHVTELFLKAKKNEIGRVKAALRILSSLLLPLDLKTLRANKAVLSTFFRCLAIRV